MSRLPYGASFAAIIVVSLTVAPQAGAQTGQGAGVSRAGRPSDTLGRTGGVYTRAGLDSMQRQRAISDLSARLGTPTSRFQRGGVASMSDDARITGPITREPFALLGPSQSVAVRRLTPGTSYMRYDDPTVNTIASISGLSWSTNYYTPEGGWGYTGPPVPSALFGTPEPQSTDTFRAFFGFSDPKTEDAPAVVPDRPGPPKDFALGIQEEMASRVKQHLQAGIAQFKAGTVVRGDAIEKASKLARAMSIFETVRLQDRADWVAPCLQFHAALDREQSFVAIRNLIDLARRYPRYFLDRPEIGTYFGDPDSFRNQMRRYRQVGQMNPTSPEAFAIEAYSSWALNDVPRAKQALVKMTELSSGTDIEQNMRILRGAIEPALEQ